MGKAFLSSFLVHARAVAVLGLGALALVVPPRVLAATSSIVASPALAWSDTLGWLNFNPTNGAVQISDTALSGYAWSQNYGWINLAPTNGGVVNDGFGHLSGYAWGEQVGWVNFSGVTINSQGQFTGDAHGSVIGTLTFSCPDCSVPTAWVPPTITPPVSGSVLPPGAPTVALTGQLTPEKTALALTIDAPGAVQMRLGWSLDTLFAPWQRFSTALTLAIPAYLKSSKQAPLFIQVQDANGRISPISPFFFDLTTGAEPLELPTIPPVAGSLSSVTGLIAGVMAGFQLQCPPYLRFNLPSSASTAVAETRRLQIFLQSFLRIRPGQLTASGFYGPATKRSVTDFQNMFPTEILRRSGLKTGNGLVGEQTRQKINLLACQVRFGELLGSGK